MTTSEPPGPAAVPLPGGRMTSGIVRIGDRVRRPAGPWTPAVHALLAHLAARGFTGAPRPLGFDEQGREVLTFLEGETVGGRKPRPAWVHAEETLVQVARWMRAYHQAVADFVPPPGAVEALKQYLVLAPDGPHVQDVKQMLDALK